MPSFWFTTVDTLDFVQTHKRKSNWLKSGDRVGQATGPLLPIHLPLLLCRNGEVLRHVIAILVFVFQETHPINAAGSPPPPPQENSCNTDLLNVLR
jgi:hypothetical protein